jgi:hypothetical protein
MTLQKTMPVYQHNPSPRVEQSIVTSVQQVVHQLAITQRALQFALMAGPCTSYPSILLPPVHEIQRLSTPPQHRATFQDSASQSNSRSASPSNASTSDTTASQAQSIPSIANLVYATDSDSVMSDNESTGSRARSKSPIENREQRLKGIAPQKVYDWVGDQRAIRILDQNLAF